MVGFYYLSNGVHVGSTHFWVWDFLIPLGLSFTTFFMADLLSQIFFTAGRLRASTGFILIP